MENKTKALVCGWFLIVSMMSISFTASGEDTRDTAKDHGTTAPEKSGEPSATAPKTANGGDATGKASAASPSATPKTPPANPKDQALDLGTKALRKLETDPLIKFSNELDKLTSLDQAKFDALVEKTLNAKSAADRDLKQTFKDLFRQIRGLLGDKPENELVRVTSAVLRERLRPEEKKNNPNLDDAAKKALAKVDKNAENEALKKLIDEKLAGFAKGQKASQDKIAEDAKKALDALGKQARDASDLAKNAALDNALKDALANKGNGDEGKGSGAGSGDGGGSGSGGGEGGGDKGSGDDAGNKNNDTANNKTDKKSTPTPPSNVSPSLASSDKTGDKKEEPKFSIESEKKKPEEKKTEPTPKTDPSAQAASEPDVSNPTVPTGGGGGGGRRVVNLGEGKAGSPIQETRGEGGFAKNFEGGEPGQDKAGKISGSLSGSSAGGDDGTFRGLGVVGGGGGGGGGGGFNYIKTGPNDWIQTSGGSSSSEGLPALESGESDESSGYGTKRRQPAAAGEVALTTKPVSGGSRAFFSGPEPRGVFKEEAGFLKGLCASRGASIGVCQRRGSGFDSGKGAAPKGLANMAREATM